MSQWLANVVEKVLDFSNILNASIAASWMILAVILLRLILKKAPRWTHVALWGLVAVRLLLPFSIESPFSLIPSTETVSREILVYEGESLQSSASFDLVSNPVFPESVTVETGDTVDRVQISVVKMMPVWIAGMTILLIYTAVSYRRLRRKVSEAVILRDNIFQSENVSSPFVLGIIKPRIYLPYTMDGRNLEHVVAHEQAHIRRKDHWWKPLGFLLLTIHWFNPLMWLAYVLLCRDIELACDEKVIKELGSEQRADYTRALVACSVNRRMIAACPLAFGEVGVKERVKSIMNYRKPTFWILVTAVVVCVIVAVCFLTDPNPSREFSMTGDNVSNLDPEAIEERILDIEDIDNSGVYVNSNNFSLTVDADFNWVDSQAIRYFFTEDHETRSAQLRIFPDEDKYFLTESEEWVEQDRIFLLRLYLEAIKYLPQAKIQQMAPADQYIIQQREDGRPSDYDRVITYSSEGVEDTDGWYIHLQIQPLHEDGEGYSGAGEEVIELFYGHSMSGDTIFFDGEYIPKTNVQIKLKNLHNGKVSTITDQSDVDSIVTFMQNIGGTNPASSKGYYGGSYQLQVQIENETIFSIGFGDDQSFNYGDYGDGYPTRYELRGVTREEVIRFLSQYDSSGFDWDLPEFSESTEIDTVVISHESENGNESAVTITDKTVISNILALYESLQVEEYSRPLSGERMVLSFYNGMECRQEWNVSYYEEDNEIVTCGDAFGIGNKRVTSEFSYNWLLDLFENANIKMIPTNTDLLGCPAGALLVPINGNVYRYELTEVDPEGVTADELLYTFTEETHIEGIIWEVYSLKEYPDLSAVLMVSGTNSEWLCKYSPPGRCSDSALQDAIDAGYVVMEEGIATHGQDTWKEFYELTQQGRAASVTVADYHTLDPDRCSSEYYETFRQDYPSLNVYQLSFDGKTYTLSFMSDNELYTKTYAYLMKYDTTEFYAMSYKTPEGRYTYVLTHDNKVTWEQLWNGLVSSQMGAYIDHYSIYSEKKS